MTASAAGTVAYITRSALSELRELASCCDIRSRVGVHVVRPSAQVWGIAGGEAVSAGDRIGTLGARAIPGSPSPRIALHVHFEINLVVNDRYVDWHPGAPQGMPDHGNFNGRNLLGLDPAEVFREQARQGSAFRFTEFIRSRPVMARVAVKGHVNPVGEAVSATAGGEPSGGARRHRGIRTGPDVQRHAGPGNLRAASELKGPAKVRLVEVSAGEVPGPSVRHLVARRGDGWVLTTHGDGCGGFDRVLRGGDEWAIGAGFSLSSRGRWGGGRGLGQPESWTHERGQHAAKTFLATAARTGDGLGMIRILAFVLMAGCLAESLSYHGAALGRRRRAARIEAVLPRLDEIYASRDEQSHSRLRVRWWWTDG